MVFLVVGFCDRVAENVLGFCDGAGVRDRVLQVVVRHFDIEVISF